MSTKGKRTRYLDNAYNIFALTLALTFTLTFSFSLTLTLAFTFTLGSSLVNFWYSSGTLVVRSTRQMR